jgi:hypothetical protein
VHVNERKYGQNARESYGPATTAVVDELTSPAFVQFLKALTGMDRLFVDQSLHGGGLHQSKRGGFLNIHADFTVHPYHRDWVRRVNVLVYLNKDWRDDYRGHLEFWDRDMGRRHQWIAPIFNRCVIFQTDTHSYHGHPEPLMCPDGVTRKSLALYYFTKEQSPYVRSTEYRARPGDGAQAALIYADKMALRVYDKMRRVFRFDDQFVSRLLRLFSGRRRADASEQRRAAPALDAVEDCVHERSKAEVDGRC